MSFSVGSEGLDPDIVQSRLSGSVVVVRLQTALE